MAWRPNQRIPGQQSKASPALAAFGGRLHMVHLGNSSNDIWWSTYDGDSWTENQRIPGQQSKASPALAAFGGRLHMVHLGNSSNDIWWSIYDGTWKKADGTPGNERIPGQQSKASPAMAAFGDWARMVHLGDSSNDIWDSEFDPAYVPPRCDIWADPPEVVGEGEDRAIIATGHRECQGTDPQPVQVTVRIRQDRAFFPDRTLAEDSEFDVDVHLTVRYECQGTGSQIVFAEVIEEDGRKAQSPRRAIPFCG